jgi:hypothetical protein
MYSDEVMSDLQFVGIHKLFTAQKTDRPVNISVFFGIFIKTNCKNMPSSFIISIFRFMKSRDMQRGFSQN